LETLLGNFPIFLFVSILKIEKCWIKADEILENFQENLIKTKLSKFPQINSSLEKIFLKNCNFTKQ
jgi:hypothetical protein